MENGEERTEHSVHRALGCARGGTRTPITLRSLDPESSASTNSATLADWNRTGRCERPSEVGHVAVFLEAIHIAIVVEDRAAVLADGFVAVDFSAAVRAILFIPQFDFDFFCVFHVTVFRLCHRIPPRAYGLPCRMYFVWRWQAKIV